MKSKERKYNIVSVWDDFCQIESSFKESVRYLPVLPENSNVWSLHYADLLLKIGTVLDSVFRDSISTLDYPDSEKMQIMGNQKRDDLNMGIYRELYEAKHNLSSKKILYLHDSPQIICPFSAWASDKSPSWWKAYNHVKHDRSLYITEATQKNTIDALASLFLIILSQREGKSRLIDLDVISSPMDNDRLKEIFDQDSEKCGVEAKAKTLLFGHVFDFNRTTLPDEKIREILSPYHRYPLNLDGGSA